VQRTGSEFGTPVNPQQWYLLENGAIHTEEKAVLTNQLTEQEMMSAAGNGKSVQKEISAAVQPGETTGTLGSMTGSEKTAPLERKGNEFLRTENSVPDGKAVNPEAMSRQNFKLTEQESSKQTVAADSQMTAAGLRSNSEEDAIGAAEKANPEIEMKGTGVDRTGFQNTILGAAAARETAEAALPGQPVETAQPYSQIGDEILTKLEQSGPTEFKMQLDPEDLGQIDIKLKFSEGKLTIDILALNAKTQALLTGQVDKLVASMGLQNVVVESVHVNQQMSAQTQDNSQSQGYTMNSAMDFSQRKQQEQYQQQFLNDGRLTGTHNRQPEEMQTGSQTSRTEAMRYGFHKMNYAV
jgi:flagellar hook-length control protein FliK